MKQNLSWTAPMPQFEKEIYADPVVVGGVVKQPATGYLELKRRLHASGIFKKRPASYGIRIIATITVLAAGLISIAVLHDWFSRFVIVAVLAFSYTQTAFLVHDTGHGQMVRPGRWSNIVGLLFCNLMLGASFSWWVQKHNRHHRSPNELGKDPDLSLSTIAFTPEQALQKTGLLRPIIRFQAYLFLAMILMEGIAVRIVGIIHLIKTKKRSNLFEALLISAHFAAYFWLVFSQMSLLGGLGFVLAHQMLFGLYMGSVFAPNHKGMPVLEPKTEKDFLYHQALTARNVRGNPLVDFWYGGLNYQIEHHLFPTAPRENLKDAQPIVSKFCRERGIPYRQDGVLQSYKEVFLYLNRVGSVLSTRETRAIYDTLSCEAGEGVS
ncbi:MAG TPA: acyl-CoA desaturase [Blastocatellia bacterium]